MAALTTLSSKADYLNQLDLALGDGDHGSTIRRGSEAAIHDLQARTFATVNQQFEAIGSAMLNSMGGASGILFGVLFRSARNCPASETMDAAMLAGFLRRGLNDLKRKSAAGVGDKKFCAFVYGYLRWGTARPCASAGRTFRISGGSLPHLSLIWGFA